MFPRSVSEKTGGGRPWASLQKVETEITDFGHDRLL